MSKLQSPLIDIGLTPELLKDLSKGKRKLELLPIINQMRNELAHVPARPLPKFSQMDDLATASVLHNLLEFDDLMARQLTLLPDGVQSDYQSFMCALRIELLRLLFVPPHVLNIEHYLEVSHGPE